MNILVLGGTRFVGRAIVDRLAEGHDVTMLNRGTRPLPRDDVNLLVADRADREGTAAVLRDPYDVVVDVSGTEPAMFPGVLTALRHSPSSRYVFISSAAVYDREETPPPFREDQEPVGDAIWGEYGVDKSACERLLQEAFPDRLTVLRPPYVYGPHNADQREQFLWARMLSGRPVYMPGDGSTRVQFLRADVLAEIVLAACEGTLPAGVYNTGERATYSFREYVELLGDVADVRPELVEIHDPDIPARDYFPFRDAELTLDVSKLANTAVGHDLPLAEGLRCALDWFHRNDELQYIPTPQEELWQRAGRAEI